MSNPGLELLEAINAVHEAAELARNAPATQTAHDNAVFATTVACTALLVTGFEAPRAAAAYVTLIGVAQSMAAAKLAYDGCTLVSPPFVTAFEHASDLVNTWLQDHFDASSPTTPESTHFATMLSAMNAGNLAAFATAADVCMADYGFSHISVDSNGTFTATDHLSVTALPSWLTTLYSEFVAALGLAQVSPLVLDLDGDGVELTSLTGGGAAPVYWDIDNDGFREASAWVKPDDGLLVRDLNSNGVIDNHSELFGTNTTNGFTALAALDSNSSGTITSADTKWGSLKVWKDTNQDGISQSGELYSLATLGITSISVNPSTVNYTLAGNPVTHDATFTMGGVSHTIVDAWFNFDNVNTVAQGSYTVDLMATALPTFRGYGTLPDFMRAMSEDPDLLDQVKDIAELDITADPADVQAAIEEALFMWAGVEDVEIDSRGDDVDARHIGFLEKIFDQIATSSPGGTFSNSPRAVELEAVYTQIAQAMSARLLVQAHGDEFLEEIPVYNPVTDTFSGDITLDMDAIGDALDGKAFADVVSIWSNVLTMVAGTVGLSALDGTARSALDAAITASDPNGLLTLEALITEVSGDAVMGVNGVQAFAGTSGADNPTISTSHEDVYAFGFGGADTLTGGIGNNVLYGMDGDDTLTAGFGVNKLYGGAGNDTLIDKQAGYNDLQGDGGDDTLRLTFHNLKATGIADGGSGANTLETAGNSSIPADISGYTLSNLQTLKATDAYGAKLTAAQLASFTTLTHTTSSSQIWAAEAGTYDLGAKAGIKIFHLQGSTGDDTLLGDGNAQILAGAAGNDVLSGGSGADSVAGDDGNDTVYGDGGDDTMYGGAGADGLYGGLGADVYDGGGGTDFVSYYYGGGVTVAMDGSLTNTGEAVGDTFTANTVEIIYGADSGADHIRGDGYAQALYGLAGDDILDGKAGNDTLVGGDGNDTLDGGAGADSLDGGNGTDLASYLSAGALVNANMLTTTGESGDATGDTFTAVENLQGSSYGDTLTGDNNANTIYGEGGNDTINGNNGNDVLVGGTGDDTINGGDGDDYFDAGDGNDILAGGNGNDTFFGGAGGDSYDGGSGTLDLVSYFWATGAVNANMLTTTGESGEAANDTFTNVENLQGSSLYNDTLGGDYNANTIYGEGGDDALNGNGGDDVLIGGAGADSFNGGSGTDLVSYLSASAAVNANMLTTTGESGEASGDTFTAVENMQGSSAYGDTLSGDNNANTLYGDGGNDTLNGNGGNDVLVGGAGSDTLNGNDGDDYFDAGDGDDTLSGGNGNDLFFGGAGADSYDGGSGTADLVSYYYATAAVNANMLTTSGEGGEAVNDTFTGVENLQGSAGYGDTLTGDNNANTLYGEGGNDTLVGKGGNDALVGGSGDDTFVFASGNGLDTITDFSVSGGDLIDVSAYGIHNIGSVNKAQVGSDTVITFDVNNKVTLTGVTVSALTSAEFIFG